MGSVSSSGDERARASGALVVCAEIWKLLPREEALEEREMFACRALGWIFQREAQVDEWVRAHPLVVFRDSTVGWPGSAFRACTDTSMASLVVDSAKSRVVLNEPDILLLFPSTTTACPATDFRSDFD